MSKFIRKFKSYIRRTYKNKLCAIALIAVGLATLYIPDNYDIGGLVLMLIIALPLFFTSKKYL
jgi:hypothetical protein